MRAAVRAGQALEFGREWQGQIVDGRYPLQEYLGGSDTTAVFVSNLPADKKTKAAIKLVRAGAEAETLLANWKRTAQLSHPNLLRVFDGGRCWLSGNELLFVVMEFAEESLAQVLPHRALTAAEVDTMLRPTVSALAYLHHQGLVHGCVCPKNVMAVGDQLKLSSDDIQTSGASPGTSRVSEYSAPELSAGQIAPAADVWSLGVTLLESLTQRPPSKADPAKLAQPYADIVRRCLIKDPSKRATVRDIATTINLQVPTARNAVPPNPAEPQNKQSKGEDRISAHVDAVPREREPGSRRVAGLIIFLVVVAIFAITLTVKLLNQHPTRHGETGPVTDSSPKEPATVSSAKPAETASPAARTAGTSDRSGAVLQQVLPNVSSGALHTIQGHVKVRLRVSADGSGNVTAAKFVSSGPSQYFARHSMDAARQWKFTAPVRGGQASPSEWNLMFEFSRSGVKAFPEQAH